MLPNLQKVQYELQQALASVQRAESLKIAMLQAEVGNTPISELLLRKRLNFNDYGSPLQLFRDLASDNMYLIYHTVNNSMRLVLQHEGETISHELPTMSFEQLEFMIKLLSK